MWENPNFDDVKVEEEDEETIIITKKENELLKELINKCILSGGEWSKCKNCGMFGIEPNSSCDECEWIIGEDEYGDNETECGETELLEKSDRYRDILNKFRDDEIYEKYNKDNKLWKNKRNKCGGIFIKKGWC